MIRRTMSGRYTIKIVLLILLTVSAIEESLCARRIKRVVGGEPAGPNQFPYQVSLRYYDVHICGGALISDRYVISAAHCMCDLLEEPYTELTAVTGTNRLGRSGEVHKIKRVVCHPDYVYGEGDSWIGDLVVIELKNSVNMTKSQSAINLPTSDTPAGVRAILSGWGRPNLHGFPSKDLLTVSLTTLSNTDCQKYYNNTILPSQLCTYEGSGKGACKGDSGSPLVYNNVLIGIFSWTKPCAIGSPDVYSNIYYYLDFIKQAMNQTD